MNAQNFNTFQNFSSPFNTAFGARPMANSGFVPSTGFQNIPSAGCSGNSSFGGDMNSTSFGGNEALSEGMMGLLGALAEQWGAEGGGQSGGSTGTDTPPAGSVSEQRGGRGADTQIGNGSEGDDSMVQRGRQGNDFQNIKGNGGDDYIVQRGGRGNNMQRAQGGDGDDTIYQRGVGKNNSLAEGGNGDDNFIYDMVGKRDTSIMKGGEGHDSATINAGKKGITVIGEDGKVLYQKGKGGNTVRVDSVEDLKVMGAKGKLLFDSNAKQSNSAGGDGKSGSAGDNSVGASAGSHHQRRA